MSMKSLSAACLGFALAAFGSFGCSGGVEVKTIQTKGSASPLDQAKQLLENYAKGQPLGSEVTSFGFLVSELKKTEPEKAEILDKGVAELQKAKGASLVSKANELLKKL